MKDQLYVGKETMLDRLFKAECEAKAVKEDIIQNKDSKSEVAFDNDAIWPEDNQSGYPTQESSAKSESEFNSDEIWSGVSSQGLGAKSETDRNESCSRIKDGNLENNSHTEDIMLSVNTVPDSGKACAYNYASLMQAEYQFRFLDAPDINKKLYRFNGRLWEFMSVTRIDSLIYKMLSEEDKKRDSIDTFCKHVREHLALIVMKDYYDGKNVFTADDFCAIENHMVFKNCVYDVKNQKELPFNSKYPYYMGVNATYHDDWKETPAFDKLCADAAKNDKDSIDMIHNMIGYVMIPNRAAKCFFVMADARDSGKSILGSFINDCYCESNRVKAIDPIHLKERFSFGSTHDVVLLHCYEMPMEPLDKKAAFKLKEITGESVIRTEEKYEKEASTRIRFKVVLATNGGIILPASMEDPAFMRRCKAIPFVQSTPKTKIDNRLPEKLAAERDFILSNVAKKLHMLFDKNGNIYFPESDLSRRMKNGWVRQNTLVDAYLNHVLKYTANKEDAVTKKDIFNLYDRFFESNSVGIKNAVKVGSKELVAEICKRYPAIEDKKLRRDIETEPGTTTESVSKKKKKPCLTCLKIREGVEINND